MINLLDYMVKINDLFATSHALDVAQELIDQFEELEGYEAWEIPCSTLYEGDKEFVAISMTNEDDESASLYIFREKLDFVPWNKDGEDIESGTKTLYKTPMSELLPMPVEGGYVYTCPNGHKLNTAKQYDCLIHCPECKRMYGLTTRLQCRKTVGVEHRKPKILYEFAMYIPS